MNIWMSWINRFCISGFIIWKKNLTLIKKNKQTNPPFFFKVNGVWNGLFNSKVLKFEVCFAILTKSCRVKWVRSQSHRPGDWSVTIWQPVPRDKYNWLVKTLQLFGSLTHCCSHCSLRGICQLVCKHNLFSKLLWNWRGRDTLERWLAFKVKVVPKRVGCSTEALFLFCITL